MKLSRNARRTVTVAGQECTRRGQPCELVIHCLPADMGWFANRLEQAGYMLDYVGKETAEGGRSYPYGRPSLTHTGFIRLFGRYTGHHAKPGVVGRLARRPLSYLPNCAWGKGLMADLKAAEIMATEQRGAPASLLPAIRASIDLVGTHLEEGQK